MRPCRPTAAPLQRAADARDAGPAANVRHRATLAAAIQTLRMQTGHPAPQYFARVIRLAGGSDGAVTAALAHNCGVCARHAALGPALLHGVHKDAKKFSDVLDVSTSIFADHLGNRRLFLNMADVAMRFGIAATLATRDPMALRQCVLQHWVSWGGFPCRLLVDGGSELEREFHQEAEVVPLEVVTLAAYAPQQNSVAERRGGLWKAVARMVVDKPSISFLDAHRTFWLTACCNWALMPRSTPQGIRPGSGC